MQQGVWEFREENKLTEVIIGACLEVHAHLGPGLLESIYEHCVCRELTCRKLSFRRQVRLPINYKGEALDYDYRADVIVENRVLIELKSVERLQAIHTAQLLTYLRLSRLPIGLLINFNVPSLKQGIRRLTLRNLP